jgi:UDPglucose 6-dehydrogenase
MKEGISVIGLGKLGAPMAACFATKGFSVVGVDVDARKVEAINRGEPPVFEPHLAEMLASSDGRLSATLDIEAAVLATSVTFIVVATPSEPSGGFSLRYVLHACERIGQALRRKDGFHVVVLTSTVMPGSTGGAVRRALEGATGRCAGEHFGLCYNPEFIALGSVIRDFLNPDLLLIGESDTRSGEILEDIYGRVCENRPPAARMNFINAEITKLALNTYVTTKISFANMLARICECLPGASVDVVTPALGLDSRIGPKYLKGAISYGGPCFPRDNRALVLLAQQLGTQADIAQATDSFNRLQIRWLADLVEGCLPNGGTVGVLGLTYKPHTDVIEEAAGFLLAQELAKRHVSVVVFDPAGGRDSTPVLEKRLEFAATALECIAKTDVVVVATPWPEFSAIAGKQWARPSSPRTVIDCWRQLKSIEKLEGVKYLCLGTGEALLNTALVEVA